MWEKIGYWFSMGVLTFSIGLFFYFAVCGFMNIQPFTFEKPIESLNNLCGDRPQHMGYCD